MATATFRIWRGDASVGGDFQELHRGSVERKWWCFDAVHKVQAEQAKRSGGALELQSRASADRARRRSTAIRD